jgi:hypothetical protein
MRRTRCVLHSARRPSFRVPDGSEACHTAAERKNPEPCLRRVALKVRQHSADIGPWTPWPWASRRTLGWSADDRTPSTFGEASSPRHSPSPRWSASARTRPPITSSPFSRLRRRSRRDRSRRPARAAARTRCSTRDRRHRPTRPADRRPRRCRQTIAGSGAAACHCRKVTTKRDPPSAVSGDSARTVPPMAVANSATIARPSPDPIRRFGPRSAR